MATTSMDRKPFAINPGMAAWLAFIGLCLLIGLVTAIQVFTKGLVITNMSDTVPWGLWITIDLSSIALGAGAFTLSAVVYLFGLKRFQPVVRLAVYVGFIGYTSALLTLVMDIGRPDRFWHPWVYWNVHSVLWEITWCITIYLTIMVFEFLPVVTEAKFFDRWPIVRKIAHNLHDFAPLLAVLGLGISLLHQSSLGATYGIVKSRPIWFKPSMPIMFILSAVAVGPALTMAVAFVVEWITGKQKIAHDILQTIARSSGFALLIYGYMKFWDLAALTYYGHTPAVAKAMHLLNQQTPYNFSFWILEILLGIIAPAFLFLYPRANRNPAALVLGAALAVIGLIVNRWNVTVSGLFVPLSYSPGTLHELPPGKYFPNLTEWGIAVGIVGYALLLLTLGVNFLPLFQKEKSNH
ncbi:MAG: polysulfide reductase NrfD [Anaerolineales bacterium]|nr:polysulfide reductase NrfD [Anaerolineales bacterium]